MENILPNKPSELIRLAIKDMQLCEKDSRYNLNMNHWHSGGSPNGERVCQVCMAGSVMAKTLKTPIEDYDDILDSNNPDSLFYNKLRAINSFRLGFLEDGSYLLGIAEDSIDFPALYRRLPFLESKPYDNMMARDLPLFYEHMLSIADEFELIGL